MKRVIRLGDPTTHGGKVVSACANSSVDGIQIARLGDKVSCPLKGHGVTTIVEGDPDWLIDGIPVALEGHKTSCGASLISSCPNLGRSYEGDGTAILSTGLTGAAKSAQQLAVAPSPSPTGSGSAASQSSSSGGKTAGFQTGLGTEVDRLIAKSPGLQKDLEQLDKDKWSIEYGPPGSGSTADRQRKIIRIDGAEKGNPKAVAQTLAHEVGHATYSYTPDYSSKTSFVDGTLGDEGAATLNNIKVQREIIANGGPDIGIAGNSANHSSYNRAYDQFLKDGNASQARQSIGSIFGHGEITSNTNQPYSTYYGNWYDRNFPAKK